ncbi:MAG: hypothetical protein KC457_02390 [Myxococcales bacterium]|nr:hypothetical protein [Myxococcales bacterium]
MRSLLRRLAQLVALLWISACAEQAIEQPASGQLGALMHFEGPPVPSLSTIHRALEERGEDRTATTPAAPVQDLPFVCERFEVRMRETPGAYGQLTWHKRLRRSWTAADRERYRDLVAMVADEMGADPRLLTLWALRESTYNPYAIHVLDPDLEASVSSWRQHRWDEDRAHELEGIMAELGARDPGYWQAKAELAKISRFRDNRHYDARIEFDVVDREGRRTAQSTSYWGFGYGPFGFNPTYYLPIWDAEAPPWVFCNDDGIAAIVTAVWAAREQQRECESLGYGDSYEVVNRRFSSGHCNPRPGWASRFRKRARGRGIDPDASAKLGKRWPADSSDRSTVITHMRAKAAAAGLLSHYALSGEGIAPSIDD